MATVEQIAVQIGATLGETVNVLGKDFVAGKEGLQEYNQIKAKAAAQVKKQHQRNAGLPVSKEEGGEK